MAYTLSRSVRDLGEGDVPSSVDRTHVINAAGSVRVGRGWTLGSRLLFYSGAPRQPRPMGGAIPREPPFYRLDLRAEKGWLVGKATALSLVLEVMNATLTKDTFGGEPLGPIVIPSVGLEARF
jgi:hypothetical protein